MWIVNRKNVEGKTFYFVDFGSEGHGRPSFRLWVHKNLVSFDEDTCMLELPITAELREGKSPYTIIARPSDAYWIAEYYVSCGYRGDGRFEVVDPNREEVKLFKYTRFSSPRGNLGISEGALIQIPVQYRKVKLHWVKSGRLYGRPNEGYVNLYSDGRVEEIEGVDPDDLEELG